MLDVDSSFYNTIATAAIVAAHLALPPIPNADLSIFGKFGTVICVHLLTFAPRLIQALFYHSAVGTVIMAASLDLRPVLDADSSHLRRKHWYSHCGYTAWAFPVLTVDASHLGGNMAQSLWLHSLPFATCLMQTLPCQALVVVHSYSLHIFLFYQGFRCTLWSGWSGVIVPLLGVGAEWAEVLSTTGPQVAQGSSSPWCTCPASSRSLWSMLTTVLFSNRNHNGDASSCTSAGVDVPLFDHVSASWGRAATIAASFLGLRMMIAWVIAAWKFSCH